MSGGGFADPDSPIEMYLDVLTAELVSHRPRELRHLLAEAEAHLRDDTAAAVARGVPEDEAEADAVARFGSARDLASAEWDRGLTPIGRLVRQTATTAVLLGAIGALAIGVSGLLAAVVRLVGGTRPLVDVAAGQKLPASACARWLALDPGARNCRDAALADWANETVGYRIAAGLLGAVVLLSYLWLRRRTPRRTAWRTLPSMVTNTIALTLFGVSGVWTLALGIDAVAVSSGYGSGQWFSAAPVALGAAAAFGARLVHDLRRPPATMGA